MTTLLPFASELSSWLIGIVFMIGAYRYHGHAGLMAFIACAVIISNIQVYKLIDIPLLPHSIAMGTSLMSLTFVAVDFLTETQGVHSAQRAVFLSFVCYLSFVLILGATVHVPLASKASQYHQNSQRALQILFLPATGIFLASVTAYLVSQLLDIKIFAKLKKDWHQKNLVLRSAISSSVAAFVDNFIFSVLAWIVFHPQPLLFDEVMSTYVAGGYVLRILLSFASAPVIGILRRIRVSKNG